MTAGAVEPVLAIDLGPTSCVVACRAPGEPAQVILVDGVAQTPTVVAVTDGGELVGGRAAAALAAAHPERAVRAPIRHLGEPHPVVVAGRRFEIVDLVATLLGALTTGAGRTTGTGFSQVRLAYPATWKRPRLEQLVQAAARAGVGDPVLVAQPVAVATAYADTAGAAPGATVAVYDLGADELRVAVVDATGERRFELGANPTSDRRLGGALFDELVAGALAAQLGAPAAEALAWSDEPGWRDAARRLSATARQVLGAMSAGRPDAQLAFDHPGGSARLQLTAVQVTDLLRPAVQASVTDLTQTVAGAGSGDPVAVCLAGAATRAPGVAAALHAAVAPAVVYGCDQPGMVTAAGTALFGATGIRGRGWRSFPDQPAAPAAPPEPVPTTAPPPVALPPPASAGSTARGSRGRPAVVAGVVLVVAVVVAIVAVAGGGHGGSGSEPLRVSADQVAGARLTSGDLGGGYQPIAFNGRSCGQPPAPARSAEVELSDPGHGQVYNRVLAYPDVNQASTAYQQIAAAVPACLGLQTSAPQPVAGAPTTCRPTSTASGPVDVNGAQSGQATAYGAVFRCGRLLGVLLAYPERTLEYSATGFDTLLARAQGNVAALPG